METYCLIFRDGRCTFALESLFIDMGESAGGTSSLVFGELPCPQSCFEQLIKLIKCSLVHISS